MRRIVHLIVLLVLVLAGSVPGLRLEAAPQSASCCCGSGCHCGMPKQGPRPSSRCSQGDLGLVARPETRAQEECRQAECLREAKPWPQDLTEGLPHGRSLATVLGDPKSIEPSPPDRQALLATFRI